MCGFLAALGTAHIDTAGLDSIDDRPEGCTAPAPAVRDGTDQDHSRVAVAVAAAALGGLDQALDLTFGQMLAIATHFAVAASAKRNCRNPSVGAASRRFVFAMIFLAIRIDWA